MTKGGSTWSWTGALLSGLLGHVGPMPSEQTCCSLSSEPDLACGERISTFLALSFLPRPIHVGGDTGAPLSGVEWSALASWVTRVFGSRFLHALGRGRPGRRPALQHQVLCLPLQLSLLPLLPPSAAASMYSNLLRQAPSCMVAHQTLITQ